MGAPRMVGFLMNILLKWMIWGCPHFRKPPYIQWEFQDPKMEVLYHIRPYFGGILKFPLIYLK
jgi:hypothetical protein